MLKRFIQKSLAISFILVFSGISYAGTLDMYTDIGYSKTDGYSSDYFKTLAQNNLRSRNEVVNEVKQRYGARVLKISLNKKAGVYYVRLLMPNGKVRNIQVNAYY